MTKEQMIERVEIAHKIYELMKVVPVRERDAILSMFSQFNMKDWNELHLKEAAEYQARDVVSGKDYPVSQNTLGRTY